MASLVFVGSCPKLGKLPSEYGAWSGYGATCCRGNLARPEGLSDVDEAAPPRPAPCMGKQLLESDACY